MPFGVDEAGKGPVLGSMFAAAIWVPDRAILPGGVADSKRLSPDRREELAARLRDDNRIRIGVHPISPARIDDPATDMNGLAVAAHAGAIEAALGECAGENEPLAESGEQIESLAPPSERTEPIEGVCDACDTDADRFARRVADACAVELCVEARHGADDEDPLVGAASVVAKVERDAHVATLATEYDEFGDLGSGYPSDPATRAFLEDYVEATGELPACARESWSTCQTLLAEAAQTGLGEFGGE